MADKDNKPKSATKPAASAKPAASVKPAPATAKTAAKPAAKVEQAKPAAEAKPKATVKPAPATAKTAAKPAAKVEQAKPAAETKPKATVKPAPATTKTAAKPTAKVEQVKPAAEAKPAPAPKTSGIAGSAAGKTTAAKQPQETQVNKSAAAAAVSATKGADKPAPKTSGIAGSAAAKQAAKPADTAKPAAMEKPDKKQLKNAPDKAKPDKATPAKKEKGEKVAALSDNKIRFIAIAAVAFVMIIALVLGIVLGARSCSNGKVGKIDFEYKIAEFPTNTAVGFSAKTVSKVERKKSVAFNADGTERTNESKSFNNPDYPKYGYTLSSVIGAESEKSAARQRLIDESDYFCAQGTRNNSGNGNNAFSNGQDGTYTWMDADGYLYRGTTAEPVHATNEDGTERKLYKHSSAAGMYYGGFTDRTGKVVLPELSDDEPAIVKQVSIRPRGYGSYSVTGVYAPAGEIIKIEISEEDMNATGGITIHIGQALYNGQSNNIWAAKGQMQRFPNILNTMNVNKNTATLKDGVYTAYVGSFVGGPLYIRNTLASFTATISGGVAYSHFILGYTTEKEFNENMKSTAPYFDLEVWNYGVLHSGSKYFAKDFSYEDIYKAAVLWDKVASVTTTNSNQGIVFLYDPFVAAGAAVAFPGRSSVNCPGGWMTGSLNYNSIVNSGSWGNFHEYHHNFQGYGVGNGGEVTNNGMTLVSYALFTRISANRGIASYGGQGLGGWNSYTSATWALNEVLKISDGNPNTSPSNGNQGLTLYATLLHNFGADNYIQAKVAQQKGGYGQSYAGYFRAWEQTTHCDMRYYFQNILQGLSADVANKFHNEEYTSLFVPVSSVYQVGRSYNYDGEKKYFKTMQPFQIKAGEDFTIDLGRYTAPDDQYASGSIILPKDFDYTVTNVSQPEHGKIEKIDETHYKYIPDKNNKQSGNIVVTLSFTKAAGSTVTTVPEDVDLVLGFEQSYEMNKNTLERTAYFYDPDKMYTDAVAAYEANFAGSKEIKKYDHTNPTQNCNTDIWLVVPGFESTFPNATPEQMAVNNQNSVHVLEGKLYFEEEGKYRIYLRGRTNCAVYYSVDEGKTYKLGAHITNGSGDKFYVGNENTYFDLELGEKSWVYVKEILLVNTTSSYIGLGYNKWTQTMFTMTETYHSADNKEVDGTDNEKYAYTKLTYRDYQGHEVAYARRDKGSETINYFKKVGNSFVASTLDEVSELTEPRLIEPTSASYINAFRSNYQLPDGKGFESEYFYTRKYDDFDYTDNLWQNKEQTVVSTNYAKNNAWSYDQHTIEMLTDGNKGTWIHTNGGWGNATDKPLQFVIDMGEARPVNRMIIYSQNGRSDPQYAKAFTLYGSLDGNDFFEVYKTDDAVPYDLARGYTTLSIDFDETTFRYYKLVITKSSNSYVLISEIEMWRVNEILDGTQYTPHDKMFTYKGNWAGAQTASTFGHVYVGGNNATVSFEFEGKRVAILSSEAYGSNFEVKIDGKVVSSIDLKKITDGYGVTYISKELSEGKHKVTIKCKGRANIDSIVTFK